MYSLSEQVPDQVPPHCMIGVKAKLSEGGSGKGGGPGAGVLFATMYYIFAFTTLLFLAIVTRQRTPAPATEPVETNRLQTLQAGQGSPLHMAWAFCNLLKTRGLFLMKHYAIGHSLVADPC
jgi:hypothetical protein